MNTLVWKANDGYASYWNNCSYAKYKLNAAQTRIIRWVSHTTQAPDGICAAVRSVTLRRLYTRITSLYAPTGQNMCTYGLTRKPALCCCSVNISCTSDTMVNKCDWGAIGRAADAQARLRLGGVCMERTGCYTCKGEVSHADVRQNSV